MPATTTTDRYTVTAVIIFNNDSDYRIDLGTAPSRRKARRIGYREGRYHYPLHSSAIFTLEIRDEHTGELVRAPWAEEEAYHLARALPTVGEVGWW